MNVWIFDRLKNMAVVTKNITLGSDSSFLHILSKLLGLTKFWRTVHPESIDSQTPILVSSGSQSFTKSTPKILLSEYNWNIAARTLNPNKPKILQVISPIWEYFIVFLGVLRCHSMYFITMYCNYVQLTGKTGCRWYFKG